MTSTRLRTPRTVGTAKAADHRGNEYARARIWPMALLAMACAAFSGWYGLRFGFAFSDYDAEAAGAFHALAGGDFAGFAAQAPAYGGSMLLRAPFALLARATGMGENGLFVAVSAPGLIALSVLAVLLVRAALQRDWSPWGCSALVVAVLCSQPVLSALYIGHPEELLVGAFIVGAALSARSGHEWTTGLLLGLAIATKQWAVMAAAPVLLALPRLSWRAALAATAVPVAVFTPIWLAAHGFAHSGRLSATSLGGIFQPAQVWWFLGHHGFVPRHPHFRVGPTWLEPLSRPLLVLTGAGCAVLWRRLRHRSDLLALLTLVLLLRCVLDPWNNVYYHVPFVLALAAWEAHAARRLPWAALTAMLLLHMTFAVGPDHLSPDGQAAVYLAWALPAALLLALAAFAPARARALGHAAAALARRAFPTLSARAPGSSASA